MLSAIQVLLESSVREHEEAVSQTLGLVALSNSDSKTQTGTPNTHAATELPSSPTDSASEENTRPTVRMPPSIPKFVDDNGYILPTRW